MFEPVAHKFIQEQWEKARQQLREEMINNVVMAWKQDPTIVTEGMAIAMGLKAPNAQVQH